MKSSQHNISFVRKVFVVLLAVAMFSGCQVVFESPLPRSLKTKQDERLFGRWMGRDEEGNPAYIQCERSLHGESSISFFVEKPKPSYLYLDYRNPIFRMTTTKIGNRDYMILRYEDASKGRGHQLARYMVEGDKLTIWIMNADKVKGVTKTGQISGEIGVGMLPGVTITDSWRKIAALLKSSKSDELFVRLGDVEKVAQVRESPGDELGRLNRSPNDLFPSTGQLNNQRHGNGQFQDQEYPREETRWAL